MKTLDIEVKLPSDRKSINLIESYILKIKENFQISDDKYYNILIVVTEAVNNAIVHGNKCDAEKKVKLSIHCNEQQAVFEIEDEGTGFDPDSIADPRQPENLLKESGRGIFLIKELSDSFEYLNNGRKIKIFFYLK